MLSVVLHHRAGGRVEEKWTSQLRLMCFYLYNISVVYIVNGLVKENKKGTNRHPKGLDIRAHCIADGRGLVNIDR
jgi:hypothetical protein